MDYEFEDLLEKQLNEASSWPASMWAHIASNQCFSGSLLNVKEQPKTSRQRKRDLVKTM